MLISTSHGLASRPPSITRASSAGCTRMELPKRATRSCPSETSAYIVAVHTPRRCATSLTVNSRSGSKSRACSAHGPAVRSSKPAATDLPTGVIAGDPVESSSSPTARNDKASKTELTGPTFAIALLSRGCLVRIQVGALRNLRLGVADVAIRGHRVAATLRAVATGASDKI